MKRILLFGATGMAGHIMLKSLIRAGYFVLSTSRNKTAIAHTKAEGKMIHIHLPFDIANVGSWKSFLDEHSSQHIDAVINCAGVLVRESENNPEVAITVNALFPKFLEGYFKDTKTKVIHISTDCVFDGKKGAYLDTDPHTELNMYGRTKSLGEINNSKDLTIRTSIIGLEYRYKKNLGLFQWFYSTFMNDKEHVFKGWSNCFWSGISTIELSDAVLHYLAVEFSDPSVKPLVESTCGLHQISRKHKISKYDLLETIKESYFDLPTAIVLPSSHIKDVDKSLVPSKGSYPIRTSYKQMFDEMCDYLCMHLPDYSDKRLGW